MHTSTFFAGLLAAAGSVLGTKYFDGAGNPLPSVSAPGAIANPALPSAVAPSLAVPSIAAAGVPHAGGIGGTPATGASGAGLSNALGAPNAAGSHLAGAANIGSLSPSSLSPSSPQLGGALPHTSTLPQHTTSGAGANVTHFDCGTHAGHASDHFLNTIQALHQQELNNGTGATQTTPLGSPAGHAGLMVRDPQNYPTAAANMKPVSSIVIPMWLHVVTTHANAGMVTPQMLQAQFQEMNTAYNPYGISFTLAGTSTSVNDTWATNGDVAGMKAALRKGTYSTLNIYLQSDMAGGILGQCTLPTYLGSNPTPAIYNVDGCQVAAGSVPGGNLGPYNMGKTAVHETGHWLGLLHTFEGYSCSGPGDLVADTAQEAQSTDGCPINPAKNTCGSTRAGYDPIHNYMDYSTDACYIRFTPGQVYRMKTLWPTYRQGM